jgi:hypothetical protein
VHVLGSKDPLSRAPVEKVDEGKVVDLLDALHLPVAEAEEQVEQHVLGDHRRNVADEQNLHLRPMMKNCTLC